MTYREIAKKTIEYVKSHNDEFYYDDDFNLCCKDESIVPEEVKEYLRIQEERKKEKEVWRKML